MDSRALRVHYGRLLGLRSAIDSQDEINIEGVMGVSVLAVLKALLDMGVDELKDLLDIPEVAAASNYDYLSKAQTMLAVEQAIAILEYGYGVKEQVVELGSLYNSIKDPQLRDRCADLLASNSKFDRVINQATLVLEDRIRKKVGGSDLTGTRLANQFIKSDATSSPIVFSTDGDEQKGYADLVRGVFLALRNGTHHQISDEFSREDAFAICAFIDRLLRLLEVASFRKDI